MNTIVLFADTNLFLQCRPLRELPWRDSFAADRVHVLVASAVQDEIDRLKHEGETRRGRRARAANTLFREAWDCMPAPLVIREEDPEVLLAFAPMLPSARTTPPTLDRTRNDDSVIEEAMLYAADASAVVQVATLDTGMLLRARRHDVATFSVPESWCLPAEPNEHDKRIRALEGQIAALKRSEPVLTLRAHDTRGNELRSITADIDTYSELTSGELAEFERAVGKRFPFATRRRQAEPAAVAANDPNRIALGAFAGLDTLTEEQASRYESAYTEWLSAARQRFEGLHRCLNARARVVPFRLRLENTGTVPADELLVELFVRGALVISVAEDDELPPPIKLIDRVKGEVELKPPPAAPRGGLLSMFERLEPTGRFDPSHLNMNSRLSDIAGSIRPVNRDRHSFYGREDDSKPVRKFSLECREFRHGIGPRDLRAWLVIPPGSEPKRAHVYCRVSARNLSRSMSMRVPITLSYTPRSTREVAGRWT